MARRVHGRWAQACSPRCRLKALDRYLALLNRERARLMLELERGETP